MTVEPFDQEETEIVDSFDTEEHENKPNLTTKLERRRRIEELNEERRMREELSEF